MRGEEVLVGLRRGKLFKIEDMDRKGQRIFKKYAVLSRLTMSLEDLSYVCLNIIV